jgi:hypothetical protein
MAIGSLEAGVQLQLQELQLQLNLGKVEPNPKSGRQDTRQDDDSNWIRPPVSFKLDSRPQLARVEMWLALRCASIAAKSGFNLDDTSKRQNKNKKTSIRPLEPD